MTHHKRVNKLHIYSDPNSEVSKQCHTCKKVKPRNYFRKDSKRQLGRENICWVCHHKAAVPTYDKEAWINQTGEYAPGYLERNEAKLRREDDRTVAEQNRRKRENAYYYQKKLVEEQMTEGLHDAKHNHILNNRYNGEEFEYNPELY
jgi:hypothetical protein